MKRNKSKSNLRGSVWRSTRKSKAKKNNPSSFSIRSSALNRSSLKTTTRRWWSLAITIRRLGPMTCLRASETTCCTTKMSSLMSPIEANKTDQARLIKGDTSTTSRLQVARDPTSLVTQAAVGEVKSRCFQGL